MSLTFAQPASVVEQERLENYFHLFSITFQYWDHLLTFPDEIRYLWKARMSPSALFFFLNRYFSVLGNIVVTVSLFSGHLTDSLSTVPYLPRTPARRDAGHSLRAPYNSYIRLIPLQSIQVAAAWEALFLYDSMLFGMTLRRAYKTRKDLRRLRIPLIIIILRDGSLYFGVMALANAVSVVPRPKMPLSDPLTDQYINVLLSFRTSSVALGYIRKL
ncbi:hypothetical protein GYMLUDRAFT_261444 [Collybiopsis luxurians FD-317 M1]|uniref:DUF6533 domain-containing protein n=1 Tax=Collybiopsis luxurians FD-317 M1 TaxID=944289 RepID=A0A0D0BXP3_9AGAR|nr:hypothetical protein GYMLUDRAFT_261444 [Collybiopsis luxurians FD-317 M1]